MRKFVFALLLVLGLLVTPATAQVLIQNGPITTAGADCSVSTRCQIVTDGMLRGAVGIGVRVDVGTSGTFNFEATLDPALAESSWFSVPDDISGAASATADGNFFFSNPGYRAFRVRASAISGTARVTVVEGYTGIRSSATLSGAAQGDGALQDGANAAIEATVFDLTNSNPLAAQIVDANGTAITSFGGGTQYTEGDVDASITGTALLVEGAANTLVAAPGTAADGLLVNLGSNNDVTVTGTVTANLSATDNAVLDDIADGITVTGPVTDAQLRATPVPVSGTVTANLSATDNAVLDDIADGIPVTNAGTFATQAAQSGTWTVQPGNTANTTPWLTSISQGGNTAAVNASGQLSITCANCSGSGASAVDDAAFTVATDSGAPAMGLFDDVTPDSVNEGDSGVLRMSANRNLYSTIRDAAGNERGVNVTAGNALVVDGSAVTQPVSGTVTANLSATDNAVLDDIADGIAVTQSGTWNVGTVTAVTAISNALPAGTNNIGDVDVLSIAAGDNNIGNVDVVTLPAVTNAGTFAVQESGAALTALQLIDNLVSVEDAVADTGFSGVGLLAVRQDSQVDLAADGDFIPVTVDADGGLRVSIVAGAGSGGTALADDADFTDGTTSGTPIGGVAESASPTTVTEGDFGWAAITLNRALKVSLYEPDGDPVTVGVDATHDSAAPATGPAIFAEFDDTTPDAVDEGDAGRLRISANRNLYSTIRDAAGNERGVNVTANNELLVELGAGSASIGVLGANSGVDIGDVTINNASLAVTNAGTFATQVDGAALTALQLLDDAVFTDDAAFTPGTSKGFVVGFQADETSPDSVDEGDFGVPRMSLDRMLYMRPGGASVHYRTSAGSTEDEHEVKATPGVLYSVLVTNTNAAARYLRCYNLTAANTTPGTSTVFWGAAIPGATTGAGFTYSFPSGLTFDTALTCTLTTGAADSDVAEVAANEIKVTYTYR